jgi:hypothetical protein
VHVIREDPKNQNLLFVGTDVGAYVSIDRGQSWQRFMSGLGTTPVHDLLIHPRDGELIAGTHGRSIWIADITPLQQWTPSVAAADATLFDVRAAVAYANDVRLDIYTGGEKQFEGENPARGTAIHFHLKTAGDAKISIADPTGRALCETTMKAVAGMNRVHWTLVAPMLAAAPTAPGAPVAAAQPAAAVLDKSCAPSAVGGGRGGAGNGATPGSYIVKLSVGGKEYTKSVQVLEDRWMNER